MDQSPSEILCLIQEFLRDSSISLVNKRCNEVVKWYIVRYRLTPSFEKALSYLCDPIPPISPLLHKLYDNAIDYWRNEICFLEDFFMVLRLTKIACTRRKIIRWALYISGDRPTSHYLFDEIIHFDFGYQQMLPDKKRNMISALATKIDSLDTKGALTFSLAVAQTRIESIVHQKNKLFGSFKIIENWLIFASVEMSLTNICERFKIFGANLEKCSLNYIISLWTMSLEQIESYFYRYPNVNKSYPYLPPTPDLSRKTTFLKPMICIPNKLLRLGEKQLKQNYHPKYNYPMTFQYGLENDVFDFIFRSSNTETEILKPYCTFENKNVKLLLGLLNHLSVSEISNRCKAITESALFLSKHKQLLFPLFSLPSFLIKQLCHDFQKWLEIQPQSIDVCFHFEKFYNKVNPLDIF